jgi:hypothetical protein
MDMDLVAREAWRPVGGRLAHFNRNWKQISSDQWILDAVLGYKMEFQGYPQQRGIHPVIRLDAQKAQALTKEVKDLAAKEAIRKAPPSREGFTSPLFLVPKSDGSWRPVINLKALNKFVITWHFKMESVRTVKGIIQKKDWMIKLDMKDAYLSVPIHPAHQKLLKFQWQGRHGNSSLSRSA